MNNFSLTSFPAYTRLPEGDGDPGEVRQDAIEWLSDGGESVSNFGSESGLPTVPLKKLPGVPNDCRDGKGPGGNNHQFGPPPGGSAPMVPAN